MNRITRRALVAAPLAVAAAQVAAMESFGLITPAAAGTGA